MEFHEKLDFLMRLTNTTNSALSLYIKLDASYISRLRRGRRRAPKDRVCIGAMASYFGKACKLDYQCRSLGEALGRPVPVGCCGELVPEIADWLGSKDDDEVKGVSDFLTGLSYGRLHNPGAGQGTPEKHGDSAMDFPQTEISVYYGVEGKRCAVLYFLTEIIAQSQPRTLLLFSDEGMDWMTMDRAFAAQFAALMREVLKRGNKIRIIHTVNRDLDEMLNAINQWLPLYMTGLIEPYFYPKKRDGIFRRTLFIAAGVAAVVSNSVGSSAATAANLLFRNEDIIKAFAEEFRQYLSQCKPLMHIYTAEDKIPYFNALLAFEKEQGCALMKTESLSLLTMTRELETAIMNRLGGSQNDLAAMGEQRREIFQHHIRAHAFTEIIRLFNAEEVENGKAPMAFSEMLYGNTVCYTLAEYIQHLEHILALLKKYDHFHVQLLKDGGESGYMAYVREEIGVIVAKIPSPPVVMVISEANLTAAFWDYLRLLAGETGGCLIDDEKTAKKLAAHIRRLKKSL